MPTLTMQVHHDGLLSIVAPLGAAAAVGTAIVIDLDPTGPPLQGRRTLADLVADGPSAEELAPRRRGVAVLPNGGVPPDAAGETVAALTSGWPFVVERRRGSGVTVAPIFGVPVIADVLQPTGLAEVPADTNSLVLPHLGARTVKALLGGRLVSGRWVGAWREVWRAV